VIKVLVQYTCVNNLHTYSAIVTRKQESTSDLTSLYKADALARVVGLEAFCGKFPEIYSYLSGNSPGRLRWFKK